MPSRHEADLDWLYGREQSRPAPERTRVMPVPDEHADRPDASAPRSAAPAAPSVGRPLPPSYPPTPAYGQAASGRPLVAPPQGPGGPGTPGGPGGPAGPGSLSRRPRQRRPVRTVLRVLLALVLLAAIWLVGV